MIAVRLPDGSTINVNTDDPDVAAKAAHQHVADNAHVKATRSAQNTFGGLVGNAVNAVIPGAADAYMGVDHIVRNAVNSAIGDEEFDPKNSYRKGQEFQRSREMHAGQDHPVLNAGANIAGAVGGFFLPAAKVGTGARLGAKALAAAKTGAGYGALSAAFGDQTGHPVDAAVSAVKGGIIGGALGAVGTPVLHGAGRLLAPVARRYAAPIAAAALTQASHLPYVGRRLGALARQAEQYAGQETTDQANRLVHHAITGEHNPATGQNWTLPEVRAEAARRQGLGVPAAPADVHETARRQFATGLRTEGPATAAVRRAIDTRQEDSGQRLANAVRDNLGPTAHPEEQAAVIRQAAQDAARPHYDEAYAAPGASDSQLANIVGNRSQAMRDAISHAHELALRENRDPTALGFDISPISNEVTLNRVPSFETLDLVKRGLNGVADRTRDGYGNLSNDGRTINSMAGPLVRRMREVNPAYGRALDAYSGEIAGRDALLAGQESLKNGAGDISNAIRGMPSYARENFALGNRSAMEKDLSDFGRSKPYGNAAARLRQNYGGEGTDTYRALQEVHGGENIDRLADVGRAEHEAFQTYQASRGNSATPERLHDDAATTLGALASLKTGGLSGLVKGALHSAANAADIRSSGAGKAAATNILGYTDLRALDRVMAGRDDARLRGALASSRAFNRTNRALSPALGKLAGIYAGYDQGYSPD